MMRTRLLAAACAACAAFADTALPRGAAAGMTPADARRIQQQIDTLQSTVQELSATVKSQNQTIEKQNETIRQLEERTKIKPLVSAPYPGAGGPPVPVASLPPAPPAAAPSLPAVGLSALNPEIGVVGDVVGNATTENSDREGADQFSFRELELVFGGYVDPYSRADFALVVNEDEGIEIEEAFLTHFDLPWDLKGQVGKFRSKFGKINLTDLNALASVNEPLVVQDFLGVEGFSHTGVRLQRLIPNPWNEFLEGTVEFVNGGEEDPEEGGLFHAGKDKPIVNTHLKYYRDLTDTTGLELGGSLMVGPNETDAQGKLAHLAGVDLTLTKQLPGGKSLRWQSEFMHASRKNNNSIDLASFLPEDTDAADLSPEELAATLMDVDRARRASRGDAWGGYSMLNYRFHPKWSVGGRADYLVPLDRIETGSRAWAGAGWITFHQSELMLVRLQYQHTDFGEPFFLTALDSDHQDDVFLQFRFQIGVDRHGLQ